MNAGELWDTAMNPDTRSLIKVSIADGKAAKPKPQTCSKFLWEMMLQREKHSLNKMQKM